MHLVVTVKTAKEPNTRIKSNLDMSHPDRGGGADQQGKLDVRIDTTRIRLLRRGFSHLLRLLNGSLLDPVVRS